MSQIGTEREVCFLLGHPGVKTVGKWTSLVRSLAGRSNVDRAKTVPLFEFYFSKITIMKTLPKAACELAPESLISLLLIININPKNNEI